MKITKPLFTFDLITLMPEMFKALTSFGVTGRAFNSGLVELNLCNPRNFTKDIHKTVDDKSYGGGPGMLMMVGVGSCFRCFGLNCSCRGVGVGDGHPRGPLRGGTNRRRRQRQRRFQL